MDSETRSNPLRSALYSCRTAATQAFLISAAANILLLTVPLYMLQLFDRVLAARSVETLILLTLLAFAALACFGVLTYSRDRILQTAGGWLEQRLGRQALAGAVTAAVDNPSAGSKHQRSVATFCGFVGGPSLPGLFDIPWVPVYLAVIFLMSPLLGILATAGAVLLFAIALMTDVLVRRQQQTALDRRGESTILAFETAEQAESVSAMGMLEDIGRRWTACHSAAAEGLHRAGGRTAALHNLSKAFRQMLQVSLLGTGAYLFLTENLSPGVMMAASIIAGRALAPIEQLIGIWRNLVQARAAYRWLDRAFAMPDAVQDETLSLPAPEGRLAVEALHYAYPGGADKQVALKNIRFSVQPGEMVAVIGASGAGKSTLSRLLLGVCKPESGRVLLDGSDVCHWKRSQLGRHVGYLPQEVRLFSGTVADNIRRFSAAPDDAVTDAAKRAGVHRLLSGLPAGYNTPLGNGGIRMSGGARQAVGLARAFFGAPCLVVLDEPFSNLDRETEAAFHQAIIKCREEGISLVVMTHGERLLRVADKVLVLSAGEMAAFVPPSEIFGPAQRRAVNPGDRISASPPFRQAI